MATKNSGFQTPPSQGATQFSAAVSACSIALKDPVRSTVIYRCADRTEDTSQICFAVRTLLVGSLETADSGVGTVMSAKVMWIGMRMCSCVDRVAT